MLGTQSALVGVMVTALFSVLHRLESCREGHVLVYRYIARGEIVAVFPLRELITLVGDGSHFYLGARVIGARALQRTTFCGGLPRG